MNKLDELQIVLPVDNAPHNTRDHFTTLYHVFRGDWAPRLPGGIKSALNFDWYETVQRHPWLNRIRLTKEGRREALRDDMRKAGVFNRLEGMDLYGTKEDYIFNEMRANIQRAAEKSEEQAWLDLARKYLVFSPKEANPIFPFRLADSHYNYLCPVIQPLTGKIGEKIDR